MPLLKLFLSLEYFLPSSHLINAWLLKIHLKSRSAPKPFLISPARTPTVPQFNFAQQYSLHIPVFPTRAETLRVGTLCYCVPSTWAGMWPLITVCFKWHVSSTLRSHWLISQLSSPSWENLLKLSLSLRVRSEEGKKTTWGIDSQPWWHNRATWGPFKK